VNLEVAIMEAESNVIGSIALVCSVVSLVVATVAFWRAGGRRDVESLLSKQRLVLGDLSARLTSGLETTLTRVGRARQRLSELSKEVSSNLRQALDEAARELAAIERETREALGRLKSGTFAEARAIEEGLSRRVHHVEATIQVIVARAEIGAAERLADRGEFPQAERLLEEAVATIRDAQTRMREELADESQFIPVIAALHDALRMIRARAEDHKREIDSAVLASDALVAALQRT
jgi:hypothetical protein